MPSSEIQASSVTYCRPLFELSKSAIIAITRPSTVTVAPSTSQRPSCGTNAPISPAASGRKRMTERWNVIASRTRDQEVEGESGDAEQQPQGVAAQVAALDRAGERAAGADHAGGPADDRALDEVGLHDAAEEAPGGRGGPDHGEVVELIEVPLVHEEAVHARVALDELGCGAGPAHVEQPRERDARGREQGSHRQAGPLGAGAGRHIGVARVGEH